MCPENPNGPRGGRSQHSKGAKPGNSNQLFVQNPQDTRRPHRNPKPGWHNPEVAKRRPVPGTTASRTKIQARTEFEQNGPNRVARFRVGPGHLAQTSSTAPTPPSRLISRVGLPRRTHPATNHHLPVRKACYILGRNDGRSRRASVALGKLSMQRH